MTTHQEGTGLPVGGPKCEGCGAETDMISPYCPLCEIIGEIRIGLDRDQVMEARKRVRAALEAALAAPERSEGSPTELESLRAELEEANTDKLAAQYALDSWLEVHREFAEAWKASGPDPFATPSTPSPVTPASPAKPSQGLEQAEAVIRNYRKATFAALKALDEAVKVQLQQALCVDSDYCTEREETKGAEVVEPQERAPRDESLCRHRYKYGACPHCETERW
jgi:hypothetical protein